MLHTLHSFYLLRFLIISIILDGRSGKWILTYFL